MQVLDAGHELVQIGIIRQIRDLPLTRQRVFLDGNAVHKHLARVKPQDAAAGLDRGGFARAVVTDEPVDFAGADVQREIVHRLFVPILLGQVFYFQHIDPFLLLSIAAVPPAGAIPYRPAARRLLNVCAPPDGHAGRRC